MTPEQQEQLRAKFKPAQIGKLPKPTKKENPKGRCDECGGYHGLPAIHLDYVGHAAVTERILSVDPDYEFGPVLDINKRPIKEGDSVLHYLTIAGSTKYEWGDGPNMKEISSDAVRRCAMRFGVALDMWAKEPLHDFAPDGAESAAPRSSSPPRARAGSRTPSVKLSAAQIRLVIAAKDADVTDDLRHRIIYRLTEGYTESVRDLDDDACDKITAQLGYFKTNREASMRRLEEWEKSHA